MRTRATQRRIDPEPWPPEWARLPSLAALEELSRPGGVRRQTSLFGKGRAGRLARLLEIKGVRTADTMIERHTNPPGDGGEYL